MSTLPKTIAIAFNEQRRNWEHLFPAEQRLCAAQMEWLDALPEKEFDALFAAVKAIEARMDVAKLDASRARLTISETGALARSPHYPRWRAEAEKVYAAIEKGIEADERLKPSPRLVVGMLPAGLPVQKSVLWKRIADHGRWLGLDRPAGEALPELLRQFAARRVEDRFEPVERTWLLEANGRFWRDPAPGITVLSFTELEPLRRAFLDRLNAIQKNLQSADEAYSTLRSMDLGRLLPARIKTVPRVREFTRNLLLSGNGALVFSNSFVQWGAAEALRRAQPQVLFACFGMRNRLKPFSSIVMFEDQSRANPTPDQPDPAGSLADAEMLAEYVVHAAQRLAPYHGRTVSLLGVEDLNRVLVLEPDGSKVLPWGGTASWEAVTQSALRWLGPGGVPA